MDECIWNIDKVTLTEKHTWWKKLVPLPLCTSKILYELVLNRTRSSVVNRKLTPRFTALFQNIVNHIMIKLMWSKHAAAKRIIYDVF